MKNYKQFITEASGNDEDDYDEYRGQMARTQLMSIAEKAAELAKDVKDDTQLEAWVESKITLAEDYIQTVYDYLRYNKKE
jgi:hypothetical protein